MVRRVQEREICPRLYALLGDNDTPLMKGPPSVFGFLAFTNLFSDGFSIRFFLVLAPVFYGNGSMPCELYTVDLDTHSPDYEAVSYCWGNPSDERRILCSHGTMSITNNLYDA